MLFALSAASALLDGLQSLSSSSPSSSSASQSATPFDPTAGLDASASSNSAATGSGARISPQTLSALLGAQRQSGTGGATNARGSASKSATSAYNQINQMIQQQAQALSMQVGSTLSLAA
ncbi:MAG TPA: hypothetical protein VFB02_04835 [Bradyrhizobium sp.]|nr:hypothetical protein [Bradyrhizobium sp.]